MRANKEKEVKNVPRIASISRKTSETDIVLSLNLDGSGQAAVQTGVAFLDHMLTLLAGHSGFDLELQATGDLEVDGHHTVEDIGICLGQALREALGSKAGINRYGSMLLPMDEALALVAVDLSGRPFLAYDVPVKNAKLGDFDTELAEEFCRALANSAALTLHVKMLAGRNSHHIIEAVFKALARSLRQAVALDSGRTGIPSTKGQL